METSKITCIFCGKQFTKKKQESYKQFAAKKFCSLYCCGKDSRKRNPKSPAEGKRWRRSTPVTDRERTNKSLAQLGEKGSGWKGGLTPLKAILRKSWRYKKWRKAVYERDKYTCVLCNIQNIRLEADHIKPFSTLLIVNKITLAKDANNCIELWDINNGRTLCRECHKATDTYGAKLRNPR